MAPTIAAPSNGHDPSCYNPHRRDHSPSSLLDCENELTLCLPNGSAADGDVDLFVNDSRQYLEKYLGPKYSTTSETAILTVVYCLIFLSGVVGNVCTGLVVVSRSYMRTSTNLYLCSLAISDILTLLFGLPTELYTVWEAYPWRFGQPYCLFKTFLTEMTSSASVLTIAAFTIERHVAICYPLLAHTMSVTRLSRAIRIVTGVWIVAAVSAVPYPLYTRTYYYLKDPLSGRFLPDSLICNIPPDWVPQMRRIFQLSTFSMFVAPMLLISALYVHIGITVRRSLLGRTHPPPPPPPPPPQQRQTPSSSIHRESKTVKRFASFASQSPRKSVIKMLVAVMLAFFVCWAPFHAQRLMTVYINEDQWTIGLIEIQSMLFYVSGILYYVSCTVNPILYNLLSHRYRRAFADVLCSECCSSSLFARWRKVSFTSEQMLQTEQPMERNRSCPNRRQERRPVLRQTGGAAAAAVEVSRPETPSFYYGSIQRQSVEMRILHRYSSDSRMSESKHRPGLLDSDKNLTEISTDRQELAESSCAERAGIRRSASNPDSKHDENERELLIASNNVGNCQLCSGQSSQETCFGDRYQLVVRCKTGNKLKRSSKTAKSYESYLMNDSAECEIIALSDMM